MAGTEMLAIKDQNYKSDTNEPFFEGVEKLLEIWFVPKENADLRRIPRQQLEDLLKTVHCEIISFRRGKRLDSYVLSESSMFISSRRWILKTCGNTTPLQCLQKMLQLASVFAGYSQNPDNVFYSRKNFMRSDLQPDPHKNFQDEVRFLDRIFESGKELTFGPKNIDCWYLYTLLPIKGTFQELEKEEQQDIACYNPEPDQTMEILMTDLDPEIMKIFTKENCKDAKEATGKSGIENIIPGMEIDDFLFEPCGYSMNGFAKDGVPDLPNGCYMTIHITPEPECSYVSFETNVPMQNYKDLVIRVIETFHPGKFTLTLFANSESPAADAPREMNKVSFERYEQNDAKYFRFSGYDLHYALYCKFPS